MTWRRVIEVSGPLESATVGGETVAEVLHGRDGGISCDADEFARWRALYGSMEHLQTMGRRSTGDA